MGILDKLFFRDKEEQMNRLTEQRYYESKIRWLIFQIFFSVVLTAVMIKFLIDPRMPVNKWFTYCVIAYVGVRTVLSLLAIKKYWKFGK